MVIEFTILFKVAYTATQSIDSPMVVILLRGSLFNRRSDLIALQTENIAVM